MLLPANYRLIAPRLVLVVLSLLALHQAKVKILEPFDIKGELDHEVSLFGLVDYQATVTIQIFQWHTESGCEPPTEELFSLNSSYPKGFLMQRGGCTYRKQSRNVHRVGGRVTLVYRDNDDDIHSNLIGGDDEFDSSHMPPVVAISKADGLKIKAKLEAGQKVTISFDYEIKTFKPPVNVRFVFSPTDLNSMQTLLKLYEISTNSTIKIKDAHVDLLKLTVAPKLYSVNELMLSRQEQDSLCLDSVDLCAPPHKKSDLQNPIDEIVLSGLITCVHQTAKDYPKTASPVKHILGFYNRYI